MNLIKGIFDFYINSSIHVALAVCALVGVTIYEFDLQVSNSLWGFIFFGTITGYNFVKYAEVVRLRHRSLNLSLKTIQVFSFFSFLALIYFTLLLSFKTLLVTGGFAALTFFYAIPFLKSKNLRALVGVKIVIVALVWAGVTVIIPIIDTLEGLSFDMWISFVQRVLIVFILTLPFEIRDLKYDELALGTLPQRVGINTTKIIGIIILVMAFLLAFFKDDITLIYLLSLGILSVIMGIVLLVSKKKQSKYFASFWVESIPIFWFVLLLLLEEII